MSIGTPLASGGFASCKERRIVDDPDMPLDWQRRTRRRSFRVAGATSDLASVSAACVPQHMRAG
ncbi:MAG: hypothetical protein KDI48_06715 [Xanthomonadales bacterium]|nr:hypothetical protein [Xanthomonadales bacterium]